MAAPSNPNGVGGDDATRTPPTIAEIAQIVQTEHSRVVELFMATIDVMQTIQDGTERKRVNFANFRRATSFQLRSAAAMHAVAVADLIEACAMSDLTREDREYVDELEAYAKEIEPDPELKAAVAAMRAKPAGEEE